MYFSVKDKIALSGIDFFMSFQLADNYSSVQTRMWKYVYTRKKNYEKIAVLYRCEIHEYLVCVMSFDGLGQLCVCDTNWQKQV